jgi:hydroxyacylglutathione hydrolase
MSPCCLWIAVASLWLLSCAHPAAGPVLPPNAPARDVIPGHWHSQRGTCMEIPEWDVHEVDRDLYILRQSPCASYEKPFVFLVFGDDRAELAALQVPELAVAVTPLELAATQQLFGIARWPTDIGHLDLGGRVLDAIPIPGHSKLSIALYDRRTQILFSGDTLYPGRLYVFDFPAFEASVARLVQFTADHPVAHVIGNHIEQSSTPFRDFPIGTLFQTDEHDLALSRGALLELQAGLASMHGAPRRLALRDFTIWPAGPGFLQPEDIERAKQSIEDQQKIKWQRAPAP